MRKFKLVEECLGYVSAPDATNTDDRYLVQGSQNVLIDQKRKVKVRPGYSRLGASNSALTPILKGWTWNSSTGTELPQRAYNGKLEVYLGTIDGTTINAWTQVAASFSALYKLRPAVWFDATEKIDLQLMVNHDANIYEWNGAVAVVDSVPSGSTVTKTGTATFGQSRFYSTRNMTVVCVRTGTEYTYTGGLSTTTLTGISDTTGLQAGDILVQKVITDSNKPASGRINDTILVFQNQLVLGSFSDDVVYLSKNTDYDDFTFSAPRIAGEGALLTLDGPSAGLGILSGFLMAFAGKDSIFKATYEQITVGSTLCETISVKKLKTASGQGAISPDTVVSIGNELAYVSNEPALRFLSQPEDIESPKLDTLSNSIKPDFDAEVWTNAEALWYRNELFLSAVATSRVYILSFIQDAKTDKTIRLWQPPQILPVASFAPIAGVLYGHSNAVPETYRIFDSSQGYSDLDSDDNKIPIQAIAKFAYRDYGERALLKNFDEFYIEGEITGQTDDLALTLNYGWEGTIQQLGKLIQGTDEDIMQEFSASVSMAQSSLATQPIAGSTTSPPDARRFAVTFEIAREDFDQLGITFSTNNTDRFWSIIASGPNVVASPRKRIGIKK